MFESFLNAFRAPDIRRRILFVLGILVVFRFLVQVPVPGANPTRLAQLFQNNALFGLLDLFSGGGMSRFSIVGLGVNPYINASIIMTLMTGVIPSLGALQREGEYGRNKINQYTRYLAVPLALVQSYGFLAVLASPTYGVLTQFDLASPVTITQILTLTAGSVLLMWLGELITEKGIGNGVSFILFAGIIGRLPSAVQTFMQSPNWGYLALIAVGGVIAVAVIIFITEGQRRIPVQYASRVRGRRMYQGGTTFLPLRVNMAGVIPIIFAITILIFPNQIAGYFETSQVGFVRDIASFIVNTFGPSNPLIYGGLYFLLTVGFTYFYTAFTFKPDETAEQLRKNGGFIPGIRPGRPTQDYLQRVVNRITVAGAIFLGIVAVMPFTMQIFFPGNASLSLGGTGLLIAVSVVVETMKQLEAQLLMRSYEGFIR